MTEGHKKLAILAIVVIGILWLFWPKSAGGNTMNETTTAAPINVTVPGFNIPQRSPIAVSIPALPSFTPYAYNAISPCMCNGAAQQSSGYNGPLVEIVNNAANAGPNVYNAAIDSRHDGISGNAAGVYAATGSYYYTPAAGVGY